MNYVDPSGLLIAQVVGGVIGMAAEGYMQYQTGTLSIGKLLLAGGTGALGGFGATVGKAMAFGTGASGLNTLGQQAMDPCQDFDMKSVGKSMLFGGLSSVAVGLFGTVGKSIKDTSKATTTITNVKFPTSRVDGPIGDYGRAGTATGAVVGGAVANNQVFTATESGEIDLGTIEVTPDDVCASPCQ